MKAACRLHAVRLIRSRGVAARMEWNECAETISPLRRSGARGISSLTRMHSIMTIRTLAAAALCTAVSVSSLQAQVTHTHITSITPANGEGEIVAHDPVTGTFWVTNPGNDTLNTYFVDYASGAPVLTAAGSIPLAGAPNSVAIYQGLVAVAVEGPTKQDLGQVQFFDAATGQPSGAAVTVGALPDMLVFTPDGAKILVANEGEADEATGLINPEGSVSVIDVASRTATTASFTPFNGQKAALQAAGVRLSDVNGISLAQDVEPEFIAVSADGATAYVTLQENNAIAVVDVAAATVTSIVPLGEKDHSLPGNEFDASNQDGIDGNFQNWPTLGYYMPDALTTFTVNGVEYIATANEGDGRDDFPGFEDETRGNSMEADFTLDTEDPTPDTGLYTSAQLNDNALLGRLKMVTSPYDIARGDTDGDGDVDQLYSFGARSFTIWDTAGNVVFDSGDALERAMLANGLWQDGRSDDKGPEPEAIVFGEVRGTPYLFVGLERTNAICVFDVTDPTNATLADVIDIPGETGLAAFGPEGLKFIPPSESPLGPVATLAVTSEVGGVLSLFALNCAPNFLTTTFASNNGQAGNMFDVRAVDRALTIECLDVNLDAGTWDLEIYTPTSGGSHVGIEQDPTAWTLVGTVTSVESFGANVPTPLPLNLGLTVDCGQQRGFYVTVTNGTSMNYTTGTGFQVGDVYASNADIEFLAGTGNVYPFANVFGPPSGSRVFNGNIHYAVQSGGLCGRAIPYGAGCGAAAASYYEQTDAANFDLAGQTVTGTWNGSGYDVSTAAGSVAPVGGAAIALPLGDDDSLDTNTVGGTLGLWVGSNCWIALGGGNSNGFSPSSSTLLSNPATGVYAWTDLRPLQTSGSGLGTVYYEENGALATVTFDGVEGWNTGLPNTVQFTYDTASGDYSITFGTLSTSNPEDWLVGYSVGGASVDPGPTDISAGSFSTPATDTQALALSSSVPVVGQTWTLEFDNISGPYAWFFFGDVAIDPGYDMTPDGAPGCFAHTNGTVGVWAQPVTASSAQMAVGIPAAASLIGVELTVQGAGRDFGNALGVSTSNGLSAKVGS